MVSFIQRDGPVPGSGLQTASSAADVVTDVRISRSCAMPLIVLAALRAGADGVSGAKDFGGASTAINLATDARDHGEGLCRATDHRLSRQQSSPPAVDFTNPTFIKQYAIVFGSTFLTVVLG